MDLKSYLVILKGNMHVILVTLVMTVTVVTFITFIIMPTYSTSTTLRIATASSGTIAYSDYMYADRLMNTYIRLATSRPVLQELAENLKLTTIPQIKVEIIPNTELIKITVESSSPVIAQKSADSLAQILIAQGKELYSGSGMSAQEILGEQIIRAEEELNRARQEYDAYLSQSPRDPEQVQALSDTIKLKEQTYTTLLGEYDQARLNELTRANIITVVEPAVLPLVPSKPNKVLNIGLGFVIGLVGGIGLAFLVENLVGTRLYTSRQIEAVTELNAIGKIPSMEQRWLLRLGKKDDERFILPFREAFRRLHVQLLLQNANTSDKNTFKTFMITSSEPGEGKTTITANLAIAMAQSGKKVVVVDCDLHIPRHHKIFGLPNLVGLSTILSQPIPIETAIAKTRYPGLFIITAGPIPREAAKLLSSSQMISLVNWLSQQYDIVLLDTPAFLAVADTAHLAPIVDGVVFVVRRNYIQEETVREACKQLADIRAPMIGLVVNDAERNGTYYYYRQK